MNSEIQSPAPTKRERPSRAQTTILALAGLTLAAGAALDFTLHFQGAGVSNPELRTLYKSYLGDIVNHIGNFGLAAAATIPIVTLKKFLRHRPSPSEETTLFDHLLDLGIPIIFATLLATFAAVEDFPLNNDQPGDTAFSVLGVLDAWFVADRTLHRLHIHRSNAIKNRVDKHFPLHNIANSVDQLSFLRNTPTQVDALFR